MSIEKQTFKDYIQVVKDLPYHDSVDTLVLKYPESSWLNSRFDYKDWDEITGFDRLTQKILALRENLTPYFEARESGENLEFLSRLISQPHEFNTSFPSYEDCMKAAFYTFVHFGKYDTNREDYIDVVYARSEFLDNIQIPESDDLEADYLASVYLEPEESDVNKSLIRLDIVYKNQKGYQFNIQVEPDQQLEDIRSKYLTSKFDLFMASRLEFEDQALMQGLVTVPPGEYVSNGFNLDNYDGNLLMESLKTNYPNDDSWMVSDQIHEFLSIPITNNTITFLSGISLDENSAIAFVSDPKDNGISLEFIYKSESINQKIRERAERVVNIAEKIWAEQVLLPNTHKYLDNVCEQIQIQLANDLGNRKTGYSDEEIREYVVKVLEPKMLRYAAEKILEIDTNK